MFGMPRASSAPGKSSAEQSVAISQRVRDIEEIAVQSSGNYDPF